MINLLKKIKNLNNEVKEREKLLHLHFGRNYDCCRDDIFKKLYDEKQQLTFEYEKEKDPTLPISSAKSLLRYQRLIYHAKKSKVEFDSLKGEEGASFSAENVFNRHNIYFLPSKHTICWRSKSVQTCGNDDDGTGRDFGDAVERAPDENCSAEIPASLFYNKPEQIAAVCTPSLPFPFWSNQPAVFLQEKLNGGLLAEYLQRIEETCKVNE